ncbi:MAG: TRAP transporter large permease, partial [Candidatus Eiseniibacteriota bacterium]
MEIALIGFAAMLILVLVLRLPIAFAMALVGFVGFAYSAGMHASLALLGQIVADTPQDYSLSVLPLFILMGNFVSRAGLSQELYTASYAFLGHRRGGLAMATIVACGGFAAICGSSLATAATMSKVAMPSMRKYGYADSLATASIASGGTLGILIPPSVIMVIYGFLTETSIRDLFAAGFIPGFLGVALYMLAVQFTIMRRPQDGPRTERMPWPERWRALGGVWGTVLLFVVVIGGIYGGVFTPTEAAGIGAGGAFLMALLRGRLTVMSTLAILGETARTTAVLFAILMGALMFSNFMTRTGLPDALQKFI